ncbi:MAG: AAA family ATPase, partial [Alphaproteobacteria bacterium]
MILSLSVNNIVLVEKLQITINSGLSALTGETGAGKSILLDAIGLVIGGRGDSSLVRKGTDKSIITAEIEINSTHPAWDILNDLDIDAQNNEPIILKRSMTAEGKSKCYVNGQPINVKDLRGLGETLVDVQGQFEQHGLLSTATHMNTLDNYAKLFSLKTEIKSAYENWSDIQKKYDIAINEYEKIKADSEYILHCLDELEKCDLQENEETELNEQKDKLKNADKLLNAYNEVYDLLNGDNGSYDSIAKSQRNIEKISDIAGTEIETALENLETASSEVLNAISIIKDQADIIQSSANDLQTIEDRLFMLSDLAKKH